jgi:NADH:ubiquinone oxidoreductase subunit 6 (subunit J)
MICLVIYVGPVSLLHSYSCAHSKKDSASVICNAMRFWLFDVAFRLLMLSISSLCSVMTKSTSLAPQRNRLSASPCSSRMCVSCDSETSEYLNGFLRLMASMSIIRCGALTLTQVVTNE